MPAQARKYQVQKAIVRTAPAQVKLLRLRVGSTAASMKNTAQAKVSAANGVTIASAITNGKVPSVRLSIGTLKQLSMVQCFSEIKSSRFRSGVMGWT